MKQRIITLLAALLILAMLAACTTEDEESSAPTEPPTQAPTEAKPAPREQNWKELKKINEEIVGWITLNDTPIDYPVMNHVGDDENGQYYLNRNYKEEWSQNGSVFVDYRSTKITDSKNVVLHAHNMNDGSMFHELLNYSDRFDGDFDYYKDHAVITFNTPEEDAKWKIISVFKTSTLSAHGDFFNYMIGVFSSNKAFLDYVYAVRIRSMFNTPVTVNESDQLLTLSTCSYEYENFRTVVVARKVRPGEDPSVDVKKASVNDDPFLPEVCYSGARPDPLDFKTAYKKKLIDWYDGKIANLNKKLFTITYANMDGSQFKAYTVQEGEPAPVPDKKPTYADESFTYTFKGWDTDVDGVDFKHLSASLIIMPQFDAKPKK